MACNDLGMQKASLTNKQKMKLLLGMAVGGMALFAAFSTFSNLRQDLTYFGLHLASVILGCFLSVVGALSFMEFRTKRLFLVMCAFIAISLAECVSLFNFAIPMMPIDANAHSFITHSMVLLMLAFFAFGIFRTD